MSVASQASISRFIASLTQDNLVEIQNLLLKLADVVLKDPSRTEMILDIDSTHSDTFGHQEHATYNGHYSANGYHPLLVFDDATGLLLGAQLRPVTSIPVAMLIRSSPRSLIILKPYTLI